MKVLLSMSAEKPVNYVTNSKGVKKFTPFKPEISKAEITKISKTLPLAAQSSVLQKLGPRCLRFLGAIRPPETHLMFWPFAYSPNDGSFKTVWGKLTKYQLFGLMAATPADTLGRGVVTNRQKGTASCRVCGKQLGDSDSVFAGMGDSRGKIALRTPTGAATHYRSHGINANLLRKNVLDKATGKTFSVLYVGKVGDIKSAY